MFDFGEMKSGLHNLFGDIDYNNVAKANIYYLTILNKYGIPKPAFCENLDEARIQALVREKRENKLTLPEQNYIRFRRLVAPGKNRTRKELLTKMQGFVSAYPNDSQLHFAFGLFMIRQGFHVDAVRFLRICTHLDPKNSLAWAHLGLLASLANDYGNAIQCSREALRHNNHFHHTQTKALVFSLLAMGIPTRVGALNSAMLFDGNKFNPQSAQATMPKVSIETAPTSLPKQPVLYFACNNDYFERFAKNLLRSFKTLEESFSVHTHLINPDTDTLNWLEMFRQQYAGEVIVSRENTEGTDLAENKSYLASSRFITAPDFMKHFKRNYLIVDADSLLNNADALLSFTQHTDQTTLYFSENAAIWDKISAPFVYLCNDKAGLRFAEDCSSYLARVFYGREAEGYWYVDQLALAGNFVKHHQHVQLCPDQLCSDIECGDPAMFWTLSNDKQHKKYVDRCEQISLTSNLP